MASDSINYAEKTHFTLKIRCPQTTSETAFDELAFATNDIGLGLCCLSWLTFDAKVVFSLAAKSVTLTPEVNLGTDTCFSIYASLGAGTGGAWQITDLSIYGLRLTHTWNGVSFESLSYLDGMHRVKDTYWEKFVIKSTSDACCGGTLAFEVATYFQDTHSTLFD